MNYSEFVAITKLVRIGTFTEKEFNKLILAIKNCLNPPVRYILRKYTNACLKAVEKEPHILKYIENYIPESLYEKFCITAVEKDGFALKYVRNQSYNICLKALNSNGRALVYVKNKTPELCIVAINNHAYAEEYVDKSIFDIEYDPSPNPKEKIL
jgi:hypothetical protein